MRRTSSAFTALLMVAVGAVVVALSPPAARAATPQQMVDCGTACTSQPQKWSDWMCVRAEYCRTGDVNGDGRSDLVSFVHSSQTGPGAGDVWVALSTGNGSFAAAVRWHDQACTTFAKVCSVADVDGDRRADVVEFDRGPSEDCPTCVRGRVTVALSTGSAFGATTVWSTFMCIDLEQCQLADVNADGRADALAFVGGSRTGADEGDVWVALSTGTSFGPPTRWTDWMCQRREQCATGDVNGDGRADAVAFIRSAHGPANEGLVWVALSTGSSFAPATLWSTWLCNGTSTCDLADVDGDGRADVVAYNGHGWVMTGLSTGASFAAATTWSTGFCDREVCMSADVNGDGRADAVAFSMSGRGAAVEGDVHVAEGLLRRQLPACPGCGGGAVEQTAVARNMTVDSGSTRAVLRVPFGVPVARRTEIEVVFDGQVQRQTYSSTNGNSFAFDYPVETGFARREVVTVVLRTDNAGVPELRFTVPVTIEPLYTVQYSPLRFTLLNDCDPVFDSEMELAWTDDRGTGVEERFMEAGETILVPEFARVETAVGVNARMTRPAWWLYEDDPGGFHKPPVGPGGSGPTLPTVTGTQNFSETYDVEDCRGRFDYSITTTLTVPGNL